MLNTDLAGLFGRERRPMPGGDHVEVVREAAQAGDRVRYTKRFLRTEAGDFRLPWRPAAGADGVESFASPMRLRFDALALIDFAFCAIHGEASPAPLPLLHETQHEYQSPRLVEALEAGRRGDLGPMRALDWRCDLFSLAALLWLYLPEP